jgi:hypothetical protein
MLHCTPQPRDRRRLCRDPGGCVVTMRSTGTISVIRGFIWTSLLLLHLTPHNNHRSVSRRSKALSTIEHHPTGTYWLRLRHEDHHMLNGVVDLCDLCILITCINIHIRHIFVSMFARLIVLLAYDVWDSFYYNPMMYETHIYVSMSARTNYSHQCHQLFHAELFSAIVSRQFFPACSFPPIISRSLFFVNSFPVFSFLSTPSHLFFPTISILHVLYKTI